MFIWPGWRVQSAGSVIFCSCSKQLRQSGEISCGQGHDEVGTCALDASNGGLSTPSDGFGPAESLLDPFAMPEGQGIALVVPGGASVDCWATCRHADSSGTPTFTRQTKKLFNEDEKRELIAFLAENPMVGDEILGTGGVRKVRFAASGRGKQGGARVISTTIWMKPCTLYACWPMPRTREAT